MTVRRVATTAPALAILVSVGPLAHAQPQFRARLHTDYATHAPDATPLADGFMVRRARVGVQAPIRGAWSYALDADFASGDPRWVELWVRHTTRSGRRTTFGQIKTPLSLEELISSNHVTLLERGLPNALVPGRRIGARWDAPAPRHTVSVMAFGKAIHANPDALRGLNVAARAAAAPVAEAGRVLHVAAAVARQGIAGPDASSTRFRQRPESRVDGTRLVDTGVLTGATGQTTAGVEAALVRGRWSVQGEFIAARVERDGASAATFSGHYAFASWFATPHSRRYGDGVFTAPAVRSSGWGALELVARHSGIDLDDSPVAGGTMRNVTLGANWYARPRARLMANYIVVRSRRGAIEDNPEILTARLQLTY